jgi:hypothetical protein
LTSQPDPSQGARQELNTLLLELALCLQRFGMYPDGHPSADASVGSLWRVLEPLLAERAAVSIGVARRQLVIDGVTTDAAHPLLRTLAERLHRHRVGALVLRRGVAEAELRALLRGLAADPERAGALGARERGAVAEWPHVGLLGVTYDQLQLSSEGEADGVEAGIAAELWLGLAQAALAREAGLVPVDVSAEEVARALNERPAAEAADQMIIGYLIQLGEELKREDPGSALVRRRLSRLIGSLDRPTLRRLVEMGGDAAQRQRFVEDAAEALAPDAVLDIMQAAAEAGGRSMSAALLRVLTKMSAVADGEQSLRATAAEAEVREQVRALIAEWTLEDPNPEGYTAALQVLSGPRPVGRTPAQHPAEPLRLVQMSLELGTTVQTLRGSAAALLDAGAHAELVTIAAAAETGTAAAAALWDMLEQPGTLDLLLSADPPDLAAVDALLSRMTPAATLPVLLDGLSRAEVPEARGDLLDRIRATGSAAVPFIEPYLRHERWQVVHSMLALLAALGARPPGFRAADFVRHPQEQVRRIALSMALDDPAEREDAVAAALASPGEETVRAGAGIARESGLPARGVGAVLHRLEERGLGEETRVLLVRLLRGQEAAAVVQRMHGLATAGRTLFGRPKLARRSGPMLAALEVLAALPHPDGRVQAVLRRARESSDPQVRAAVERHREAGAAPP